MFTYPCLIYSFVLSPPMMMMIMLMKYNCSYSSQQNKNSSVQYITSPLCIIHSALTKMEFPKRRNDSANVFPILACWTAVGFQFVTALTGVFTLHASGKRLVILQIYFFLPQKNKPELISSTPLLFKNKFWIFFKGCLFNRYR